MEIFRQMQPLADDRAGNWPGAMSHRRLARRPKPLAASDKPTQETPTEAPEPEQPPVSHN